MMQGGGVNAKKRIEEIEKMRKTQQNVSPHPVSKKQTITDHQ
jgi:hypothetical protein